MVVSDAVFFKGLDVIGGEYLFFDCLVTSMAEFTKDAENGSWFDDKLI